MRPDALGLRLTLMTDDATFTDVGRGGGPQLKRDLPALTIVFHPEDSRIGTRRVLTQGDPLVLGRGSNVFGEDALRDNLVSRKHASVSVQGAVITIADLGSHNGTFVNGERVDSVELGDGDVIELGHAILLFHRGPLAYESPRHSELVGGSYAMAELLRQISMVAKQPVSVLIQGETGVGKELVARAIHAKSGRAGDLVALNCGSLSEGLVQSELFGHVRGAFSGAGQARRGLVETAAGGTLFLDEIGDAPPVLQTSLLRLLEQREYRQVGSDRTFQADVRVIAATHVPLQQSVADGRFRQDLLARLERWVIDVPPLRERREDIVPLALHFASSMSGRREQISRKLAHALLRFDWPTNVRGLRAAIEQALVECNGAEVIDLTPRVAKRIEIVPSDPKAAAGDARKRKPRRPSDEALKAAFIEADYSITVLADRLGVSRNTLYRWFHLAGLDPQQLREDG